MAENDPIAAGGTRADFWRELLIALAMGLATLASAWSSYQSALWEGIQTFRLADMASVGREIAVEQVALGQQHVLDLFLLERFLDAREDGDSRRADFIFGRLPRELQAATRTWLESRPGNNPDAVPSPFHLKGYVQAGTDTLEALRGKQATLYADADHANKTSDNYTRLTVFFGLVLFLAGMSAVIKTTWSRHGVIAGILLILAVSLVLLARMPLATE